MISNAQWIAELAVDRQVTPLLLPVAASRLIMSSPTINAA